MIIFQKHKMIQFLNKLKVIKKIIIIKSKLIFFKKQLDDSGIYNDGGSRQIETLFNIIKYKERVF